AICQVVVPFSTVEPNPFRANERWPGIELVQLTGFTKSGRHLIPGSSWSKINTPFLNRSNSALYLIRGFRSVPNFRLCTPCQFPIVETSSRNCSRSCCTFCGVEAFCPITTDGKRRLIPWLVGTRLLMNRLKCTTNWFSVRAEATQVWVPCHEMFSLVAFWNALAAGGPPTEMLGSMRKPSVEEFRWKVPRKLKVCAAFKGWSNLATISRSRNGAGNA